jgi:hypothetical protein
VKWNEGNRVVQCHNCGESYIHNAALAARDKELIATIVDNAKQLAAEREKGIDTGGLIEAARTIQQLREQLAAEREK